MGMVEVNMVVANPRDPDRRAEVRLWVDTGATWSMVPRQVLEQIGITPLKRAEFQIADGRRIHRDIAEATFFWEGEGRTSVVIFGDNSHAAVLGVVALESLALEVDPYNNELRPATPKLYGQGFDPAR